MSQKPEITNLPECIEDVRQATLDGDKGPADPTNYRQLLNRLKPCRSKLPPLYQVNFYDPYYSKLQAMGRWQFTLVLLFDAQRQGQAGLMLDLAHAILQNGEKYQEQATDGFQEVISDLYDGFLSAEDRHGVKPPDFSVIAPLVKWGRPDFGPYTWPMEAASQVFGVQASVVNLPPANGRKGLLAWSALPHECAGHDILSADKGLPRELSDIVRKDLEAANMGSGLPDYWASRIDETASDVLGILNMGPAAGIGLIGYFRGMLAAYNKPPKLRSEGPARDPHPADVLRGYLASSTVRLLNFGGAAAWADVIAKETDNDVGNIVLAGKNVTKEDAKKSAEIVANALATSKVQSLESHALGEIQNWRDSDEQLVTTLRPSLSTVTPIPEDIASGIYAAHVAAAAVMEALSKNGRGQIPVIFGRMLTILKEMHDKNPTWGPLYVQHPGDLTRRLAFVR